MGIREENQARESEQSEGRAASSSSFGPSASQAPKINTDRIRSLGWTCKRNTRQALCLALNSMLADSRLGRL